jgi:hypothetical protein
LPEKSNLKINIAETFVCTENSGNFLIYTDENGVIVKKSDSSFTEFE